MKLLSTSLSFLLALGLSALVRAETPILPASAELARPLAVGSKAPAITLSAADGSAFALGAAFAEKPTVLVFYRGSWCPFCNRQLAALAELEPTLVTLGFQILGVSPDSAAGLRQMTEKNRLNYRLLSDRAMLASTAYGVAFRLSPKIEKTYRDYGVELAPIPGSEGHWLPVPTVFLVGRDGIIKFVYSNPDYKIRLAASDLLAAAKATMK